MGENQKKVFKGYFCLILGVILCFSSLFLIYIYANIFLNPYGALPVIILFLLSFSGILLMIMSQKYNIMLISDFRKFINPAICTGSNKWFIQGVPNNNLKEFSLNFNEFIHLKKILLKEEEKGIYILNLENKIIKFDMRGWFRKEYYIYEYFSTIIQIKNKNKIYKKYFINNVPELKIIFMRKNGKEKCLYLVKNHKTFITLLFSYRLKIKYKILSMNDKCKFNSIKKFYHFNEN
jgi:hypothetical protein